MARRIQATSSKTISAPACFEQMLSQVTSQIFSFRVNGMTIKLQIPFVVVIALRRVENDSSGRLEWLQHTIAASRLIVGVFGSGISSCGGSIEFGSRSQTTVSACHYRPRLGANFALYAGTAMYSSAIGGMCWNLVPSYVSIRDILSAVWPAVATARVGLERGSTQGSAGCLLLFAGHDHDRRFVSHADCAIRCGMPVAGRSDGGLGRTIHILAEAIATLDTIIRVTSRLYCVFCYCMVYRIRHATALGGGRRRFDILSHSVGLGLLHGRSNAHGKR
jgi:hypothetical protein